MGEGVRSWVGARLGMGDGFKKIIIAVYCKKKYILMSLRSLNFICIHLFNFSGTPGSGGWILLNKWS